MAYTTPTILPSGTTFAQLKSGGFQGQLNRLADANAYPANIRSLMTGPMTTLRRGIVHALDAYLQGDPMGTADINARLLSYATALKAIATALDEANVLVNTNPGTLAANQGKSLNGGQRRMFS